MRPQIIASFLFASSFALGATVHSAKTGAIDGGLGNENNQPELLIAFKKDGIEMPSSTTASLMSNNNLKAASKIRKRALQSSYKRTTMEGERVTFSHNEAVFKKDGTKKTAFNDDNALMSLKEYNGTAQIETIAKNDGANGIKLMSSANGGTLNVVTFKTSSAVEATSRKYEEQKSSRNLVKVMEAYFDPKTTINKEKELLTVEAKPSINKEQELLTVEESMDLRSLIRGDNLPPTIHDLYLSRIKKISLVISHCDNPLGWISDFISGFETLIDGVWVFTKCDKEVIDAPQGSNIIKLENVGRCDHTYAHWISNYFPSIYDAESSTNDIIVFLKDTDYGIKEYSNGRIFKDMLSLTMWGGLGCMHYGYATKYHNYTRLKEFHHHNPYQRRPGTDAVNFFNKELYSNLGEWIDYLQVSPTVTQTLVPVCYGGTFAATTNQFTNHSKEKWDAIEKSLSRGDSIEEGHFMERLWASLLSKHLSDEVASAIWALKPQSSLSLWAFGDLIVP